MFLQYVYFFLLPPPLSSLFYQNQSAIDYPSLSRRSIKFGTKCPLLCEWMCCLEQSPGFMYTHISTHSIRLCEASSLIVYCVSEHLPYFTRITQNCRAENTWLTRALLKLQSRFFIETLTESRFMDTVSKKTLNFSQKDFRRTLKHSLY